MTKPMPSTPRKIAANRANAQKSTGPRTAEGKARAARNSVKHGLNSDRVLIPDETYSEFEEFRQALLDEFQPATPDQATLFEHMVAAAWRLRRIRRLETDMFEALLTHKSKSLENRYDEVDLDHPDLRKALLFRDCSQDFLRLSQYESRIYNQYRRNRADLIAAQAAAAKAQAEAQAKVEAETQTPPKKAQPSTPAPSQNASSKSNKKRKIRVISFVPPNSSPASPGSVPPSSGGKRN
jgi:hypothetical protein